MFKSLGCIKMDLVICVIARQVILTQGAIKGSTRHDL
jgi:hypothetical protein